MKPWIEEARLVLSGDPEPDQRADFAEDLRRGLAASPRSVSCRFLYDDAGSRLFEELCTTPEYYPTRAEAEILERCADELVALRGPGEHELVELGSGSATKTRLLLEAFLRAHGECVYRPIDISRSALEESSRRLLAQLDGLRVDGRAGEYLDALAALGPSPESDRLVLWLGGSIGNFDRAEAATFLSALKATLEPDDALVVGFDLRKDRATLEAAYDDAAGVTERFIKNVLVRANVELGANFDPDRFRYRARYQEPDGFVEMTLESEVEQRVTIPALPLEVTFAAGEALHVENSYKYDGDEVQELANAAGLRPGQHWLDGEERFRLQLLTLR